MITNFIFLRQTLILITHFSSCTFAINTLSSFGALLSAPTSTSVSTPKASKIEPTKRETAPPTRKTTCEELSSSLRLTTITSVINYCALKKFHPKQPYPLLELSTFPNRS